jgi:hypothetical protein
MEGHAKRTLVCWSEYYRLYAQAPQAPDLRALTIHRQRLDA